MKGPILALRATIPQSPALRVKHRNRPVTALSREEQEALELEELRRYGSIANCCKHLCSLCTEAFSFPFQEQIKASSSA